MGEPVLQSVAEQDAATRQALLELNNANARETSFLSSEAWQDLIAGSFSAQCVDGDAALLITFDQSADYGSPNFVWFQERMARFVYVDRIIVNAEHRGRGLARLLYEDLFGRARGAGHDRVVCEVNRVPPNPGSDAFHDKLGFTEVGRAVLAGGEKTVRYLSKVL